MTTRTTQKDLDCLVNHLNRITGNNPKAWQTVNGRNLANIGTYVLNGAYGGWKLAQITNEGGGERNPISMGYVSKKECYYAIHAYISGIEDCIRGEEELNQKINTISA